MLLTGRTLDQAATAPGAVATEQALGLVSGEVLGQRPMSQMRPSLTRIEQDAGLSRLVLRPLSAKVLPVTIPEEAGIVDRERLYGITGRSRKDQMELALQFGILEYPNAAGGCLLTDQEFGNRVRDLFEHQEEVDLEDMELLRIGRHFRIDPQTKLIVGRNEEENATLKIYLAPGRLLLEPEDFPGPTILMVGPPDDQARRWAVGILRRYTKPEKRPPQAQVICRVGIPRQEGGAICPTEILVLEDGIDPAELEEMRI